jgi:hypothetical protein
MVRLCSTRPRVPLSHRPPRPNREVIARGWDVGQARLGILIEQIEEWAVGELREIVREEKPQDSRAVLLGVGEMP